MLRVLERGRNGRSSSSRRRRFRVVIATVFVLVAATGCDLKSVPEAGFPDPITVQGRRVMDLWKGAWVAAAVIGFLVWGLIIWSVFRYRKRGDRLPPQVRYNLPIEVLYTVLPAILVGTLFYFTAVDEAYEDKLPKPDLVVGVVGFQWNWQFNYYNENVQVTGQPGAPAVLVLPTHETIRFIESSPDVIHAFWVPEFLFKRDVIPGRYNQFSLEITKEGTYTGHCAEFCGVDHDRMDFILKAVSPAEFNAFVASSVHTPVPPNRVTGIPGGTS